MSVADPVKMSEALETLPSIGHVAMSNLLEDFKNEIVTRIDKFETSIDSRVDDRMDAIFESRLIARNKRIVKWARLIFPAIPGSFFTWLIMIGG